MGVWRRSVDPRKRAGALKRGDGIRAGLLCAQNSGSLPE